MRLRAPSFTRFFARVPRGVLVGAAAVLFVGAIAGAAFGPLVRARVAREAERRHLHVEVGSVRPGWLAVTLGDVGVRLDGVDGVDAHIDELRVELTPSLSVATVGARGGVVRLDGEPEELAARLRTFRERGAPRATDAASDSLGGGGADLYAEGFQVRWSTPSGGALDAAGGRVSRVGDTLRASAETVMARAQDASVEVRGVDVEVGLGANAVVRRVAAQAVALGYHPPPRPIAPATSARSAVDSRATAGAPDAPPPDVPPPLPVVARTGKGKKASPSPAAVAVAPSEPVLPMPDLRAMRARIATIANVVGGRVPDGMKIEIGGLSAKIDVSGDPMAFGPGPFTLERHGDRVRVSFTSDQGARVDASPQGTALTLAADLPLAGGDVTARLSGGPVSLALLGVKEGTKGLFDVAKGAVSGKGQVTLSGEGDALTFDGELALSSISVKQPRLSMEPLRGLDFSVRGRGVLSDGGRLRLDDAQIDVGALHLRAHGAVEETRDHFTLSLTGDVAPSACQALLESAPEGLLPTIRTARMTGTFGAKARVVFDTRAIDDLVLEYDVDDRCRMAEVPPELAPERFTRAFTYRTYKPDGTAGETTTGPGTSAWTSLEDISPFMLAAVLTTEDGAFYKHHGFNHSAIRNSVAANLKARRFARGASTITMQLAKNLFLSRQKTLSRKIEEVILTDYLEQVLRKDDMMELYLNVVEFGPDVYGVTRAAEHYFGRKPEELNPREAFFLASVMPAPLRYGKQRDRGQVSDGWGRHLDALLNISARYGKISRAEAEMGRGETLVFYRAGEPRPEPRPPAAAARRDPFEDDATWQPLD